MAIRVDSRDSSLVALWSDFVERNEQNQNYASGSVILMIVFMAYRAFLTAYCSCPMEYSFALTSSHPFLYYLPIRWFRFQNACICWENRLR